MKLALKSWWGPRAAIVCILGFAGMAAIPLIHGALSTAAKGESLSIGTVMEETKRKMHEDEKNKPEKLLELKAAARLGNGTLYLGSKGGLLVREGERWMLAENGPADEVKSLAATGNTLWIAGKNALYQYQDGKCSEAKPGDFHSVSASADGSLLAVSKKAVFSRDPAGNWEELKIDLSGIAPAPKKSEH